MSVIAYANGFTLWHYADNTPLKTICDARFFNPIYNLLNIGDIVIINASGGDTALRVITQTADSVKLGNLK